MSEPRSAPEGAARLASALADRYRIERELGAGGISRAVASATSTR